MRRIFYVFYNRWILIYLEKIDKQNRQRRLNIVRFLIRKNAKLNLQNIEGNTALSISISGYSPEIAKILSN